MSEGARENERKRENERTRRERERDRETENERDSAAAMYMVTTLGALGHGMPCKLPRHNQTSAEPQIVALSSLQLSVRKKEGPASAWPSEVY